MEEDGGEPVGLHDAAILKACRSFKSRTADSQNSASDIVRNFNLPIYTGLGNT